MDIVFLDAPYSGKVELCSKTLSYLKKKKYKTVGLYASVQFIHVLDEVLKQLTDAGIKIVTSKADRTHVQGQLLGCDNYHNSLNLSSSEESEVDCYLYVGDGKFHPLALVYLQKDKKDEQIKEVVCNDPTNKSMTLLEFSAIKTILRKYRGSLMKFLSAQTVGVLVTIKPGQEQLKPAFILEKTYPKKRFYYFIDNVISFDQLENFPFIDVWVNTACPRIGFDDQEKFERGVINLNDALACEEILRKESVLTKI